MHKFGKIFRSWPWYWLIFLVITSLFSPMLAHRLPWLAAKNGNIYFPAFSPDKPVDGRLPDQIRWEVENWFCVYPLWRQDPEKRLYGSRPFLAPGQGEPKHIMGTDQNGRDVFARLLHAGRHTLKLCGLALIFTAFIAILLGCLAGALHKPIKILWTTLAGFVTGSVLALTWFDWWSNREALLLLPVILAVMVSYIPWKRGFYVAADTLLIQLAAVLTSVPRILIILVLGTYWTWNVTGLALCLALLSWPGLFRMVYSITKTWYGGENRLALDGLGIPKYLQWSRHLSWKILPALIPWMASALAGFVLLEAALGFLQVSMPSGHYGWGSLLIQVRKQTSAWWLIVFPGIIMTISMLSLYSIGKRINKLSANS